MQFISILEKESIDDLIPFLQTLDAKQKKELAAALKEVNKEYLSFITVRVDNASKLKQKASKIQREMIWITGFVCCSLSEFERIEMHVWILESAVLEKVIGWYCPDWFSEFVNRQIKKEFLIQILHYEWIMDLTEKGYLIPSKELIVQALPSLLFGRGDDGTYHRPERLLQRPITLNEHIWWFFEVESELNWADRYIRNVLGDWPVEERNWENTLKKFASEGLIDRQRLLKESLLATNKNFDKPLSNWFMDLFQLLKPDKKELIAIQSALIGILNAPHSKPVNTVLGYLKEIADDKDFLLADFLPQVPALLSSETKNIVVATLSLLEKLAQGNIAARPKICQLSAQTFIHIDEQLQVRAAKLIDKYRNALHESFSEILQPYASGVLSPARALLGQLLTPGAAVTSDAPPASTTDNVFEEIPSVNTVDDIVFLASQVFDNNQSWHIEQLPAVLVGSIHLFTGKQLAMLEPALQRALKIQKEGVRSNSGMLEVLVSIFFIDVCILLMRREPQAADGMAKLFRQFSQKDGLVVREWTAIGENDSYLRSQTNLRKWPWYNPHARLLMTALEKIKANERIPLLSTPTHAPGYIDPAVFISRLASYQRAGMSPANIDLQIAVSRILRRENTAKLVAQAREKLSGEWLDLTLFLIGAEEAPAGPLEAVPAWICAALAKPGKKVPDSLLKSEEDRLAIALYQGNYVWNTAEEMATYSRYDEEKKQEVIIDIGIQRHIKLELVAQKKQTTQSSLPPLFYDELWVKDFYMGGEEHSIRRLMLLSPHNPDPLLAQIIRHHLIYADTVEVHDKKIVTTAVQTLYDIWAGEGEMSYLFLGTCLLTGDKTINGIAAEIWLRAVTMNRIDNERLGKIIATHEKVELAPLKRLTDVMTKQLFQVSPNHNRQLQRLISHILANLGDKPIKNLKKLKEIHAELLKLNEPPGKKGK